MTGTVPAAVTLRRVETLDELQACADLQEVVWGSSFQGRVPAAVMRVAEHVGGVTAGAFDPEGALLGFVFGLTGPRQGRLVHWSHMLAVLPEVRDRGLGTRLKLLQRELVRQTGAEHMLWTFDPLVSRNAHLNLNHLRTRVVEYVPNMYGEQTGSPLHAGIGTDRLIVRWDVAPARSDRDGDSGPVMDDGASLPMVTPEAGDAAAAAALASAAALRIEIPLDLHRMLMEAPERAVRWRAYTRAAFLSCLERGHRVRGFHRDLENGRAWYVLARA
ncbi:MAG TPA: hypothetical protein VJ596_04090 [Gemmatimonadaceae bacterium]|nr:hypothetical protein [Gemmatimonadaceae bacterium]